MNCDICFWNKHFGIEMKSNTIKISMANGKWFLLISSSRTWVGFNIATKRYWYLAFRKLCILMSEKINWYKWVKFWQFFDLNEKQRSTVSAIQDKVQCLRRLAIKHSCNKTYRNWKAAYYWFSRYFQHCMLKLFLDIEWN